MSQSLGWLLGSIVVPLLLDTGMGPGMRLALVACAAFLGCYFLFVLVALRDLRRDPVLVRAPRGWLRGVVTDLVSLYENPKLLALCVLAFFMVAGNSVVWGFFAVYFVEHLHADVRALGTALAISAVTGLLFFPLVGPLVRRFGGYRMLAVGTSLYLLMYAGMALSRNPFVTGLLWALPLYGIVNVSTNALASEYSSRAQRGGGLGVLNGTYALAMIVGPLAGGLLADRVGLGGVPWISFGFVLVASVMAWRGASARSAARGRGALAASEPEIRPTAEVGGRNGD